eukprot:gnl/MRDRNA2_/MRDRNA2_82436_c0_seq8.p1 gnl/MRDRNA2_/MRDRNA2_82436_c0~~gnl/MRDRNA2_/MRDRNA2_82436_c0_seq8.p1  ORF type:complete len:1111 (+),score=210.70 gnl/MRDRNA2_/MRDRNA2_82436_c0_seq8:86-3418(+)
MSESESNHIVSVSNESLPISVPVLSLAVEEPDKAEETCFSEEKADRIVSVSNESAPPVLPVLPTQTLAQKTSESLATTMEPPPIPQKTSESPAPTMEAGLAWKALRKELGKTYFGQADDDLEVAEYMFDMAEAVFAYEAMSTDERYNATGRQTIQNVSSKLNIEDVAKEWEMLRSHKRQILDGIGELFKRATFGQERNPKVGYSAMKIQGQDDVKKVCFVPAGMSVPAALVNQEVLGKKGWQMTKPNMLIKLDCGSRHPSSLSTPKLMELPAFKQLEKTAALAVQMNVGKVTDEQKQFLVQSEINQHLQVCLAKEIVTAITDATFKTNNWIVIDRSNSKNSSPSAELILETSLSMSTNKPTVLVLDSISRYNHFKPSRTVNMQLLLLGDVLCRSVGLDDNPEVSEIESLYKPKDFDRWEPYHARDPLMLSDPALEDSHLREEGDRRLPRPPEEEMIMVDEIGRKRQTSDGRPLITKETKWLFHYRQYLFNGGSHYVIFENSEDSSFPLKSNGAAWPEGSIFAHGGNLSYERIKRSLSTGTPTVMLYNTGGVAQTFGSLHNWCVSQNLRLLDECARTGKDPMQAILAHTDMVSSEPWTKKFGVSSIAEMQRLVKRAPEVMRKSVVVVDVLKETPEQVVEKVTGAFASGGKGLPELGLGSAEEDIVLDAWKTHMILTSNAKRFRRWGDFFYYFSLFLTFISSIFAVLITKEDYLDAMTNELNFDMDDFCKRLLLIIPIVSSIVASVINNKRMLQKWAALKTAASQITAEIYKFRNRVLEYDAFQSQNEGDQDDGKEDNSPQGRQPAQIFNPREIFVQRFQDINKFVDGDGVDGDSLKLTSTAKLDLSDDSQKEIFKQRLRRYVPREVYGGHEPTSNSGAKSGRCLSCFCCAKRGKDTATNANPRKPTSVMPVESEQDPNASSHLPSPNAVLSMLSPKRKNHEDDLMDIVLDNSAEVGMVEPDDFVSPMVIETYIEYRAKLLLKLCASNTSPLAKSLSRFQMALIILGGVGTLLSALDKPRWVAVTVAAATCLMNIMQHEKLQQRLDSTNSAVRDLNNNHILMNSLSIVSRRTQEIKTLCVNTVETAILETTTTWTGMSARPSVQVTESGKEK